jgi:hypothetical protein
MQYDQHDIGSLPITTAVYVSGPTRNWPHYCRTTPHLDNLLASILTIWACLTIIVRFEQAQGRSWEADLKEI